MKKTILSIFATTTLLLISCNNNETGTPTSTAYEEVIAVANRGAGTISLMDAKTNNVNSTIAIPGSEPMYVVYVPSKDKLYVGDRAGKKIHIVNPKTKAIETAISVGNGVFHMWADGLGNQLWVNNDIDNTISVINLNNNTVVQTINVGMKPHDVFVTQNGSTAYVSVFNSDPAMPDKIFSYSTSNYAKTGEANVGKDPHLFHLPTSNKLFVPCQSGQLYTLNGSNLSLISNNAFEGAHGVFASPDQSTIFVTNISGQKLYSINSSNSSINGTAVNAALATPHNIVINEAGNKMFVTHSGPTANNVSVYKITGTNITSEANVVTGNNPFGIAYYKRVVN